MSEDQKNQFVPMISYWLERDCIPPSVDEQIEERLEKLEYIPMGAPPRR